jgi:enamine deaminase RidA (YjgF/YER057c/UK114 family)
MSEQSQHSPSLLSLWAFAFLRFNSACFSVPSATLWLIPLSDLPDGDDEWPAIPYKADKTLITGRLGKDMTIEQGKEAAKQTGLAILATVKETLGSLNKVKRLVKSFGMVNCTDDFADQPKVINGYSELMKEVFGDDAGVGARSAVGHNSLPGNIAVEIECIFEVA